MKDITLLCRVVDNYGDIGFVYRLARSISRKRKDFSLRLIVSNLSTFKKMADVIDEKKSRQEFIFTDFLTGQKYNWQIFDWNASEICKKEFSEKRPQILLECFQCGRPEWLDEILFEKENKTFTQIINLEYLTLEDWGGEFHLLPGGTRSPFIKKMNFIPGLTKKTGGLLLDDFFTYAIKNPDAALKKLSSALPLQEINFLHDKNYFCLTYFSYPKNYKSTVLALKNFSSILEKNKPSKKLLLFLAQGLSQNGFLEECKKENASFKIINLPYLKQEEWDCLLTLCDFNFIRGEDSFARAILSGHPFVWHAYIQAEEFQLVKVDALLKTMQPFFSKENFSLLKKYFLLYNRNYNFLPGKEAGLILLENQLATGDSSLNAPLSSSEAGASLNQLQSQNESTASLNQFQSQNEAQSSLKNTCPQNEEEASLVLRDLLEKILSNYEEIKVSFKNFADYVISCGDLADNLLSFIDSVWDNFF